MISFQKHRNSLLLWAASVCALFLWLLRLQFLPLNYQSGRDLNPKHYTEVQRSFLPLEKAQDFCGHRRLDVYPVRDRPRRIYDLFLVHTELDWLEIRLHELDEEVDYFVILESPSTFQNRSKPLYLRQNLARFEDFQHKVIHQELDFSRNGSQIPKNDTWTQEKFTRNALFDQIIVSLADDRAPNQGDVLLVSDIDEIPRPSTLVALRNCAIPARVTLGSAFYYYSFQWPHRGQQWHHPHATFFDGMDTVRPDTLRGATPEFEIYNAAWHCSSCFPTIGDLLDKITAFSHKEFNQPRFLDPVWLLQAVRKGKDLFDRPGELYDRMDDNRDLAGYLLTEKNLQKFAYILDRDPLNANYEDVEPDGKIALVESGSNFDLDVPEA